MRRSSTLLAGALSLSACAPAKPPVSPLPSAEAALAQLRSQQACAQSLHASAKVDNWSPEGRIRSDVLLYAAGPASLRLDAIAFGVNALTLTSDGAEFRMSDLRGKQFLVGRASACNLARVTQVPVPGEVLVGLLRGKAPVLKHQSAGATQLRWDGKGYYVLDVQGAHASTEQLKIAVHPEDFGKPWAAQRLRVLGVRVTQQGIPLYQAELEGHQRIKNGVARVDPEGIDDPIAASGPACDAELPRTVRLQVPEADQDVLFRFDEPEWNPPLPPGVFTHEATAGLQVYRVECDDRDDRPKVELK